MSCFFVIAERPTIFFDSHDVSKPDSVSLLSILDDDEKSDVRPTTNGELLDRVISMLRVALEMNLFGVDIVVEKSTGHYAIIDINAFPGMTPNKIIGLSQFAMGQPISLLSPFLATDVT